QTGFIIMAVIMDWGFMAIIIALLIYMVFNFVIVFFLSRRYVKFSPEIDFSYWRKFLKESMPMGISVFITFLYFKLDTIMLSVIKTNADVGIYSAAYKIIENITFFPAMIAGLVLPLISRHIFSNKDKFEDISNKTFKVFFLLVVPLIVGTMFLSEGVINLIGGAGFEESANVLRVLVFALAFIFFGHFFNNILLVGNLQKKLMVALAFCAVFNITANLILIPRYSYAGAAITSVFTEMLVVSLTFYLVLKYLKYRPKIQHGVRILFSGLVMAAFLFVFKDMNFFILAFGSAGVYSLFLWLTKTISSEEILSIVARRT
ncbi:MAG TPA: flippase, partial [Candidatus Moranbacteria bacterium]|nr:flippase [Candidatus Moranbacteria bacterium]